MKQTILKGALGALILSGALATSHAAIADDKERTYEITITNATFGHPIAPSLFVTHKESYSLFELGGAASPGLAAMAETGSQAVLQAEVDGEADVSDSVFLGPKMFPQESYSTTIIADKGAKYFSAAGMLAATNDGFYAVRSVRLPKDGSITVQAPAYDAGSEANTEQDGHIPFPNGHNALDNPAGNEEGFVHVHRGIVGGVDYDPAVYGWKNPVVEVTITRIDDDDDD